MAQTSHEAQEQKVQIEARQDVIYKTKKIQFLGRTTDIILQNDNVSSPLVAICNVLLLRNNLHLNPNCCEISQERLLTLVAERLIESNCNVDSNDEEYIENHRQKIADAIDLLPRLATGIDVNIKFRRIDDFEFTPEQAIFDLLDIPLYHGWIVDPQDIETALAIGCKSYNDLTTELAALETHNVEARTNQSYQEASVDFSAALGIPSPSLSRTRSSADFLPEATEHSRLGKGDIEEQNSLLRTLRLSALGALSIDIQKDSSSEVESIYGFSDDTDSQMSEYDTFISSEETAVSGTSTHGDNVYQVSNSEDDKASDSAGNKISVEEAVCLTTSSPKSCGDLEHNQSWKESGDKTTKTDSISEILPKSDAVTFVSPDFGSRSQRDGVPNALTSSTEEPLYEGEEESVNAGDSVFEYKEPAYEGESLLGKSSSSEGRKMGGVTPEEGELITKFLKNSATQLTTSGLFSLQEGLKEHELCVFFHNNHFCTMLKYQNELYLLATDQGYLNQPDLVWEKLNKVNGSTMFTTCDFKVTEANSGKWDEQEATTNTAEYIASINSSPKESVDNNLDLQLAIALQQEEYENLEPARITEEENTEFGLSGST